MPPACTNHRHCCPTTFPAPLRRPHLPQVIPSHLEKLQGFVEELSPHQKHGQDIQRVLCPAAMFSGSLQAA
eukprot:m.661729 g.661729  ORF g.661729 m.661729 type:complete len:71 (+) comp58467_c1_seq14:571-783(+)